ncbi:hypothetical protein HUJ04_007418 [Dendroctonus ponderosae]|nr:hypothetical protein HUJ04_007418 [Dendroctonus ponderosae]
MEVNNINQPSTSVGRIQILMKTLVTNPKLIQRTSTADDVVHDRPIPKSHKSKSFSVCYQNVRGLRTKLNELMQAVYIETWLNEDFSHSELNLNNYNIYRTDRNSSTSKHKRGGGVLIAVRKDIGSSLVQLSGINVEQFLIVTAYLPPGCSSDVFNQHCTAIDNILDQQKNDIITIICGDYNLPNVQWIIGATGPFMNVLSCYVIPLLFTIYFKGCTGLIETVSSNATSAAVLEACGLNRFCRKTEPVLPTDSMQRE